MTRLDLTLKMAGADGRESIEHRTVEFSGHPDAGALHRVFHVLPTELRVTAGDQALPQQNERARAWLKFSGKPASIMRFFDIRNAQTMPTARTLQDQELMPESKSLCLENGASSETVSQRKE